MEKFDLVDAWLDNVAYSHSGSESTRIQYKRNLANFCLFIGKTPKQILGEYEKMRDREFRRKYAQYVRALISKDLKHGYAPNTIQQHVTAVTSFFKYNDLPLGHVPIGKARTIFHNRDITKEEVQKILEVSRARDKAFFCMMAQSGLRPYTLCRLRIKHIEPEFGKGIVPCKIDVPEEIAKGQYHDYFTFMGEESVKYLKAYLSTRASVGPEDYLFTLHGTDKQLSSKSITNIFLRTIEKLKEKGLMDFEQKQKHKPHTVRLYNLRKFFRKFANQAGFEFVQFWMGHIVKAGQEESYRPRDVEFHRQLYKEKAMPFLRFETATPSETDKIMSTQAKQIEKQRQEIHEMKKKLSDLGITHEKEHKELEKIMELLSKPAVMKVLEDAARRVKEEERNPEERS